MKKQIIVATLVSVLLLTGCAKNKPINVNTEDNTSIAETTFGISALVEIGDGLWYDATTQIVYWWNGCWDSYNSTIPSPYYSTHGRPYRYNPETNTFEEVCGTSQMFKFKFK